MKTPDYIKFPLVLMIVGLISALSLAALYKVTKPIQADLDRARQEKALRELIPEADTFDTAGREGSYIIGKDKRGEIVGYAAIGEAEGYSSVIRVMVATDTNLEIKSTQVLSQQETPGLGDKIKEVISGKTWATMIEGKKSEREREPRPWFQEQFRKKSVPLRVKTDGGEIEAITGATISSRAMCEAINRAVTIIREGINR